MADLGGKFAGLDTPELMRAYRHFVDAYDLLPSGEHILMDQVLSSVNRQSNGWIAHRQRAPRRGVLERLRTISGVTFDLCDGILHYHSSFGVFGQFPSVFGSDAAFAFEEAVLANEVISFEDVLGWMDAIRGADSSE